MESLVEIADVQLFDVLVFLQVGASDIVDQNVDPVVFFQCQSRSASGSFRGFRQRNKPGKLRLFRAFNSWASRAVFSLAKSARTTVPPSDTMRRVVASPIPEAAPVTITTLSLNLSISISCFLL